MTDKEQVIQEMENTVRRRILDLAVYHCDNGSDNTVRDCLNLLIDQIDEIDKMRTEVNDTDFWCVTGDHWAEHGQRLKQGQAGCRDCLNAFERDGAAAEFEQYQGVENGGW